MAPFIADSTRNLIPSSPFLATYLTIFFVTILAGILLLFTNLDSPVTMGEQEDPRSLTDIIKQRNFITSTLITAISYMIMGFVMIATPLAMEKVFLMNFSSVAVALTIHFLGMFAPSLITGKLIQKFGVKNISGLGYFIINIKCDNCI